MIVCNFCEAWSPPSPLARASNSFRSRDHHVAGSSSDRVTSRGDYSSSYRPCHLNKAIPIHSHHRHSDCTHPNQETTKYTFTKTKAKGSQEVGGIAKEKKTTTQGRAAVIFCYFPRVGWVSNSWKKTTKKILKSRNVLQNNNEMQQIIKKYSNIKLNKSKGK